MDENLLPREKALYYGLQTLTNKELLALVLKSAYKNTNVFSLSNDVINKAGGFRNLLSLTYDELIEIKGIKKAKALEILAMLEIFKRLSRVDSIEDSKNMNALKLVDFLRFEIGFKEREEFYLILINSKGDILKAESMYRGTSEYSPVAIDEILRNALMNKTKYVVVAHNHPSDNVEPSEADVKLTKAISDGCRAVGLKFLDHLIVSRSSYFSFKSAGLLLK